LREVSNWALIAEVSGLSRVRVSRPITKAATAAGMMKRQAETPAARMAISSLRRFRPTNAPRVPNRKMNGVSTRMVAGACSMVRNSSWAKPTSARVPTFLEMSTKAISMTSTPTTARAPPDRPGSF
jgi:hypothetical protein